MNNTKYTQGPRTRQRTSIDLDQAAAGELRLVRGEMSKAAGHAVYVTDVVLALIEAWRKQREAAA